MAEGLWLMGRVVDRGPARTNTLGNAFTGARTLGAWSTVRAGRR